MILKKYVLFATIYTGRTSTRVEKLVQKNVRQKLLDVLELNVRSKLCHVKVRNHLTAVRCRRATVLGKLNTSREQYGTTKQETPASC